MRELERERREREAESVRLAQAAQGDRVSGEALLRDLEGLRAEMDALGRDISKLKDKLAAVQPTAA